MQRCRQALCQTAVLTLFATLASACGDESAGGGAAEPGTNLADGLERFRNGDLAELRTAVGTRLEEAPSDAPALMLRARIARVDDEYYPLAFDSAKQAIAAEPTSPATHSLLGFLEFDKGRLQAAKDAFEDAIELDKAYSEARAGLSAIALTQGDTDRAAVELQSADAATRDADPMWHLWKGELDLVVGDIDSARDHLERAHVLDRQDLRIALAAARVSRILEDPERSEAILRVALSANPAHLEPRIELAEMRVLAGAPEDAVRLLSEVEDELESGRSLAIFGQALLESGDPERAETQLKRALRFGADPERIAAIRERFPR